MQVLRNEVVVLLIVTCAGLAAAGQKDTKKVIRKEADTVSFSKQVFPIIKAHCLPCHAEENFNPSELSMDSYDQLMEGGKHGAPILPGKSKESIIIQKVSSTPPFGDQMPLDKNRKKGQPSKKSLTPEEIKTIAEWIDQGAKKN